MVYRYGRVVLGLLLLILLLAVPTVALADNPDVHITVAAVVIGYPGNFTVTYVNDYQVDISWTIPVGGNNTMVRGAVGRYPGNMTDGYLVYLGNGTFATDTGVSLDETVALVYYRAWTQNDLGVWSAIYSEGSIGGKGMIILGVVGLMIVCICLMGVGFWKEKEGLLIGATIMWLITGAFSYSSSTITWDVHYGIAAACIAMAVVSGITSATTHSANDRKEQERQQKLKVVVVNKSYGERLADWEKRSGIKSRAERDDEAEARTNKKLRKRYGE